MHKRYQNNPSLLHVTDVVSAFLGPSPNLTLARAVSFDSLKLLNHIWANSCVSSADRTPGWSLLNFLRSDRYYYRYAFSVALEEAAHCGLLHMVEWLFAHFSGVEAEVEVVEAAANAGHLHILQFLFDHSTCAEYREIEYETDFLGPRRQYPDDGIVVRWGRHDALRATKSGHDEIVRWLFEHTARTNDSRNLPDVMKSVFNVGDLPLAEWLMTHGCPFSASDALASRCADVGQWLLRRGHLEPSMDMIEGKVFAIWAGSGHLELMQLLVESHAPFIEPNTIWSAFWQEAMEAACDKYHLPVVRWLLEYSMGCTLTRTSPGSVHAAGNGHLELAQFLYSHGYGGCSAQTMYDAAEDGNLPVVEWIQPQFSADSSIGLFANVARWFTGSAVPSSAGSAMNVAAINGHLEVLQFLHSVDDPVKPRGHKRVRGNGSSKSKRDGRKPWSTQTAMDGAAANGHLEVVQWLHVHRSEGCTTVAMNKAAAGGHLPVVQWLHANRSEGCTTLAMDDAAANGHIEVAQWLHANRSEDCTCAAMDFAASNGHLNVVQWLHATCSEGCTVVALVGAIEGDHLRVVQWLLMTLIEEVPSEVYGELFRDAAVYALV
ncbi:hypothetical protein BBJ28_00020424 [Nothophytophthora sp. Chile5]|nr:hypothetical protein BBJ28_00020424 [Nothophytophthora sp. Chile5]